MRIWMPGDRLTYSVAEVAYKLSVSTSVVRNWIRFGEIPAERVGRIWVIPKEPFERWFRDLPSSLGEPPHRAYVALSGQEILGTVSAPSDLHAARMAVTMWGTDVWLQRACDVPDYVIIAAMERDRVADMVEQ